jgi:hypothetical protein
MNGRRKIVVVFTLAIVALIVATGWTVLAGEAWPPKPYQAYSLAGHWTTPGANTLFWMGPEDASGASNGEAIHLSFDPTVGGGIPTATANSPVYFRAVRTGSNTWQLRGLMYFTDDAKPAPTILFICVVDGTATMTAPGQLEITKTISSYLGSQDKDLDGTPDADEEPVGISPPDTYLWTAL